MNHKSHTYILLTALSMLMFSSCTQEEPTTHGSEEDDDRIIFNVSLPGVETRSYDNIQMGDLLGGFTVAAHNLEQEPDANGKLSLYFEKVPVERTEGMGAAFRSDLCKWPGNKDGKEGRLRIYAFYPSLETLKQKSGIFEPGTPDLGNPSGGYFYLHDISTTTLFSYRIGNLKVNRDISRHVDVVTAIAEGTKSDNLYSGVNLEFSHKLTRIDFKAWSANPSYDIEIAGVRIGNVIVSSTLNMEGNWLYGSATEKKPVEYIFREGDTLVKLDGSTYTTAATATSIMGNGGWAMIIPGNPENSGRAEGNYSSWNKTGTNNGVYFSVLMRVTDRNETDKNMQLYPYIDGSAITDKVTASNKNSIYFQVEKATNKIVGKAYKDKTTQKYFTDAALTKPFTETDSVEVREYGWAAMPFSPKQWWEAGKQYTYVLDYSKGIGLHAPDDDAPGKPIITSLTVGISEEGGDWEMVKKYEEVTWEEGEDKDFTYIQK